MKPDKPEDHAESWLRKMSDKLSRRNKLEDVKMSSSEPEEESAQEDEPSYCERVARPKARSVRKVRKEPKAKDVPFEWGHLIFIALMAYGFWLLFFG